jgi:hypothetical protein
MLLCGITGQQRHGEVLDEVLVLELELIQYVIRCLMNTVQICIGS